MPSKLTDILLNEILLVSFQLSSPDKMQSEDIKMEDIEIKMEEVRQYTARIDLVQDNWENQKSARI